MNARTKSFDSSLEYHFTINKITFNVTHKSKIPWLMSSPVLIDNQPAKRQS
jgi:hypothetical protein